MTTTEKTEQDLIKAYEREYDVTLEALPETVRVKGNALASEDDALDKEAEDEILARLESGDIWAWFTAKVTVRDSYGREASDFLGCCSYKDERDFKQGGYYLDMIKVCLDEIEQADPLDIEEEGANPASSLQPSTLTHLLEIYTDTCDTLKGQSPEEIGYDSLLGMMEEFKWKLEAIEEDLRAVFGDLEANPQ
jgi:hypothetical protein